MIVSGKGGVGKSTVSAAIGMAAAGRGLRTLLIEVASQERMSLLFDQGGPIGYHATPVYPGLDAFSIDPQKALEEYLVSQLKVRAVVERLVETAPSGTSPPPPRACASWSRWPRSASCSSTAATTSWSSTRPPPGTASGS